MRNGSPCPKCQARDILKIPDQAIGNIGLGNRIAAGWRTVRITRYLCCNCGFLEDWVDKPEDIARVRAKYGG